MTIKLSKPPSPDILIAAYEKHIEDIRVMPQDRLQTRITFDFPTASTIVLGALPAVAPFHDAIHDELPKMPLRLIAQLESITFATMYVYFQLQTAPPPESKIAKLYDVVKLDRKKLLADANSAIGHELMDPSALDHVPTGNGRLDVAQAVLTLCVAFRASWSKIKGQSPLTEEKLTKATQNAMELLAALGRDDNPATATEVQPIQAQWLRAASFFYYVYDECRRAVSHLRWREDDVSDIAPAFFGVRGPRAKADDAEKPVTPPTPPVGGGSDDHEK